MADPYCLAMCLCDLVHRDPATNKCTILGTFSNVTAKEYPADIVFCVYFTITDGVGPTTLRLQLIDAKNGFVDACNEGPEPGRVFLATTELNLENPLLIVEGAFVVQARLEHEGLYYCELWANDAVLMSRRLSATTAKSMGEE
jgi:hypothetical protein